MFVMSVIFRLPRQKRLSTSTIHRARRIPTRSVAAVSTRRTDGPRVTATAPPEANRGLLFVGPSPSGPTRAIVETSFGIDATACKTPTAPGPVEAVRSTEPAVSGNAFDGTGGCHSGIDVAALLEGRDRQAIPTFDATGLAVVIDLPNSAHRHDRPQRGASCFDHAPDQVIGPARSRSAHHDVHGTGFGSRRGASASATTRRGPTSRKVAAAMPPRPSINVIRSPARTR
jgi:hypothetical protein